MTLLPTEHYMTLLPTEHYMTLLPTEQHTTYICRRTLHDLTSYRSWCWDSSGRTITLMALKMFDVSWSEVVASKMKSVWKELSDCLVHDFRGFETTPRRASAVGWMQTGSVLGSGGQRFRVAVGVPGSGVDQSRCYGSDFTHGGGWRHLRRNRGLGIPKHATPRSSMKVAKKIEKALTCFVSLDTNRGVDSCSRCCCVLRGDLLREEKQLCGCLLFSCWRACRENASKTWNYQPLLQNIRSQDTSIFCRSHFSYPKFVTH
jgi:hypothetical protein